MAFVGRGINTVRTVGNQDVDGYKTFNSGLNVKLFLSLMDMFDGQYKTCVHLSGGGISFVNNNITKGSTGSSQGMVLSFDDKNDSYLGYLQHVYTTGKNNTVNLLLNKAKATTDTESFNFKFVYETSPYFYCATILASTDNQYNLGGSNYRWKQVYAATATINTSDERLKQDINNITDDVLDAWGEVNWQQFKFIDAVASKGEAARHHVGLIAQRIKSVFEAHGLDVTKYGLFCYDEWDIRAAEFDKDGNEITPEVKAGNRYSLRYEECLSLEAAYQRRRADRIEKRLEALEKAINND